MLSRVFDREDTTLYSSWNTEEGGVVILFIPGMGELRMTPAKAEEVAADLARQAEYVRYSAIEEDHDKRLEQANLANQKVYPQAKGVTK